MSAMAEWVRRCWYLLNRRRLADELEREMAAHRAMMEEPRRFGSVLRLREEAADAWGWSWLDDLWRDVRYGARQLRRAPGFALAALSILTIGAGVTLAIFHLANAVSFHLLSVPDADALVRVSRPTPDFVSTFPFAAGSFYREHNTLFSFLVSENRGMRVSLDDDPEPLPSAFVSGNYFRDLKVRPVLGRLLDEPDAVPGAPPTVVLGHRYWQRHFDGDVTVLNRVLRVNGQRVQVVGVVPSNFDGLARPGTTTVMAVWFPMAVRPALIESSGALDDLSRADTALYGRLEPGVTAAAAAAQLRTLSEELHRRQPGSVSPQEKITVVPVLERARFEADVALLFVLVLLIFLSACANLGNMLLARGLARHREIDIRVALGASRWRVARQLMTENLMLAVLGSATGLGAGYAGARLLQHFWDDLPPGLHIVIDWHVLLASAALMLLSVFGFGLTPAVHAGRRGRTSTRARQTLVAVQVAASCVLLILATLLTRGAERMRAVEFAFDYRQTIVVDPQFGVRTLTPVAQRRTLDNMAARLERVSGVDGVAVARAGGLMQPPGLPTFVRAAVSPSYFRVVHLPVVRGRTFFPGEQGAIMLSESTARTVWPNEDALGRTWQAGRTGNFTVVGVVKDSGLSARGNRAAGEVYLPLSDDSLSSAVLVVHTSADPRTLMREARATASVSGVTPTVTMMQAVLDSREPAGGGFFGILGSLATLLAFTGILGLVAFAVAQRTREIGVRMALGAQRGHILRTLLAQYAAPLAVGCALGTALAIAGGQVLRNQLYGLAPLDPISYITGIAGFGVVALLAILLPARRALRIDPASALRWE